MRARLLAAAILAVTCKLAQAGDVDVSLPGASSADTLPSVVWAVPLSGHPTARPGATAIIDQVNKQFVPQVTVIQTGTTVSFPNRDNIRHHVYSFSPAKPFELKLYSGKPANPVVFDHPGVVTMGCNIHDVMLGYVVVVDSPWHAVADPHGVAHLHDLPPGEYQLHSWVPGDHKGEGPPQPLHVAATGDAVQHVELLAAAGTQ